MAIRPWLRVILHPCTTFNSIIQCFSSYDEEAWASSLKLLETGKKLAVEMIVPMFLLQLVVAYLPFQSTISADGVPPLRVGSDLLRAFSPYALDSLAVSSSQSSIPVTVNYLLRLSIFSVLSPVAMDLIFNHFSPIVMQVCLRLMIVLLSRKGPDESTKLDYHKRVKAGRIIRRSGYDLYLPPLRSIDNTLGTPTSEDSVGFKRIPSLIFFPGFAVQHMAYADVAFRISEYGVPVTVVSLEPLRLAHRLLGAGMNDVRRLLKSAGKDVVKYYKQTTVDRRGDGAQNKLIVDWSHGGHSMGGYAALQLGGEILQMHELPSVTLRDGSVSQVGTQIIAWAAGNIVQSVPNLRTNELGTREKKKPLRVLILLASNDNIAKFASNSQRLELMSKLPQRTTTLNTIAGGNHCGFASYDTAVENAKVSLDGVRDIPLEVQHGEACSQTVHFLLGQ
eukprot:g3385.t1 g3385   contig12:1972588-1973934(-)